LTFDNLASTITTRSQAENLGYYLAGQLADPDDPAVRVQTMQHNLLTAVNHTLQQIGQLPSAADYPALEQAVMRMAYTYSLYSPAQIPDATGAADPQPDFLNRLWWAQNDYQADQLDEGIAGLTTYLQGVEQPAKAIQFVSNLLLAAKQTVAIQEDLQDPLFFQELLKFGFEYAKLNPDTSLSAEPQGFLDLLWRAQAGTQGFAEAIKKGAAGISNLFGQLKTKFGSATKAERVELLELEQKLFKAIKQVQDPALIAHTRDPKFLAQLVELAGNYDALPLSGFGYSSSFFLETLRKSSLQDASAIQQGATQLNEFLKDFNTAEKRLKLLDFQNKLLKSAKLADVDERFTFDPDLIGDLVDLGRGYASLNPSNPDPIAADDFLKSFLNSAWTAQSGNLKKATADFQDFFQAFPINTRQVLQFQRKVIETAKLVPGLQGKEPNSSISRIEDTTIIGGLLSLSNVFAYNATRESNGTVIAGGSVRSDTKGFFADVWRATTQHELALAADVYQNNLIPKPQESGNSYSGSSDPNNSSSTEHAASNDYSLRRVVNENGQLVLVDAFNFTDKYYPVITGGGSSPPAQEGSLFTTGGRPYVVVQDPSGKVQYYEKGILYPLHAGDLVAIPPISSQDYSLNNFLNNSSGIAKDFLKGFAYQFIENETAYLNYLPFADELAKDLATDINAIKRINSKSLSFQIGQKLADLLGIAQSAAETRLGGGLFSLGLAADAG
jgi:hypothetical protein